MGLTIKCDHDSSLLKEEKTIAGLIYRCPKCNCVYRMMLVTNDAKCYAKRFPVKAVNLAEYKKAQRTKK